jgi:hypothetical protein
MFLIIKGYHHKNINLKISNIGINPYPYVFRHENSKLFKAYNAEIVWDYLAFGSADRSSDLSKQVG